ncbi:hypothetical protein KBD20_01350 [Candidatus Saccharibacteria bacterium]|nr:hypothetical protein [Candidatus Saccharibacteria bacterium]
MAKRIDTSPYSNNHQPRVRPGFEKLIELDSQLDRGVENAHEDVSEIGSEVKTFALDAFATACRFEETDPALISLIVQRLDDVAE